MSEEAVAEAVLEVVQVNNPRVIVAVAVASAAVAGGVTYFTTRHILRTKYDQILQEQIEAARRTYSAINKDEYPSPADRLEEVVGEVVNDSRLPDGKPEYVDYTKHAGEGTVVVGPADILTVPPQAEVETNVLFNGEPLADNFDWDEEVKNRRDDTPYIISHLEYDEKSEDYEAVVLTWFEGDGVLMDAAQDVVEDEMVGLDNLHKFGHGSRDNNVLYVFNPAKDLMFEVLRSTGSYAKEVLGFDEPDDRTLRHSGRRYRGDDE